MCCLVIVRKSGTKPEGEYGFRYNSDDLTDQMAWLLVRNPNGSDEKMRKECNDYNHIPQIERRLTKASAV